MTQAVLKFDQPTPEPETRSERLARILAGCPLLRRASVLPARTFTEANAREATVRATATLQSAARPRTQAI